MERRQTNAAVVTKVLALCILFTSCLFALVAGILAYDVIQLGGQPISPRLFGPEVAGQPAMTWIYLQQAFALWAAAGASGIASRSDWHRFSAVMMTSGSIGLAVLMGTLAHFARTAPDGIVMFAMCIGVGMPLSLAGAGVGGFILIGKRDVE